MSGARSKIIATGLVVAGLVGLPAMLKGRSPRAE
jgi:hypothetical protein